MKKRLFFSCHYNDHDELRADVVRNHWQAMPGHEIYGRYEPAIWESVTKQGDRHAVQRLIDGGINQANNLCVLIGSDTYDRLWVRYEIFKSFQRRANVVGVHINSIMDGSQETRGKGENPFEHVGVSFSGCGKIATLWEDVKGEWVEYKGINGSASFAVDVPEEYRDNAYDFSSFYNIFSWVDDDGVNNMNDWFVE